MAAPKGTGRGKGSPPEEKKRAAQIIQRLRKAHPDAKLALNFSHPLELLVALILAAQARDDLVNQVTAVLFLKYRTPADYARAPLEQLEADVRRINFYRNKAKTIHHCCEQIVQRFGGTVPDKLEDLLSLPGVGRKTANILIGNAFGRPAIGVDTHVMRLSQRLGFTVRDDPDKIEFDLMPLVPERDWVSFCHLLQWHGRRICLARNPRCPECPVNDLCPYPRKEVVALL